MNKMTLLLPLWMVLMCAIVADAGISMRNPFYCYMTDSVRSTTMMHSTYTSYEAIRRFNFTTVDPTVSTCTPSRFWYLGKFGCFPHISNFRDMISFAESSIQADIVRNYDAGRTTLCRKDFEAIRDWRICEDFTVQNVSLITLAGGMAIENIARRFQQHFPDILTESYSHDRFYFRHTDTDRTNASARAFASGLFGDAAAQNDVIYEDVPKVDWLLHPFGNCQLFSDEVHPNNIPEREAFLMGPEVEEMVESVNRRLGFHGSNQLSLRTVFVMWDWCTFETSSTFELSNSTTGPNSVWCAPFTIADQLVLEYLEDLRHFNSSAYGVRNQRLLVNLYCDLLQDLISLMQSNNVTDRTVRVFFTYIQALQGIFVALDLFRDTWPPHQHNYAEQSSRKWLTSVMQAFGSNLAIIRYDCEDDDHDLIFLVNERPALVPGCNPQTGKCKLSFIVNKFQRFIGVDCETSFCTNN